MGPLERRDEFDRRGALDADTAPSAPIDLDDGVRMPWEEDGQAWHTVDHADAKGNPVGWDPAVLIWLVDAIQASGGFCPTDFNHRTRIEITADKSQPWFCHVLTGFKELLEVAIRVPHGTFDEARLRKKLKIKTLDERSDLPVYGQWDRIRIRRLTGIVGGWDDIRLSLRDFKDITKGAFRSFLKEAASAYADHLERRAVEPELSEPWKTKGREWHLSQNSMSRRQKPRWKPDLLLTLIGRFKAVQPDLELDWKSKTAVRLLTPPGRQRRGKIVTNMGRGLRVELRAPRNTFTPTQLERLGEDADIRPGVDADSIVFWVRSLTQINTKQLLEVWRRCDMVESPGRLQSA